MTPRKPLSPIALRALTLGTGNADRRNQRNPAAVFVRTLRLQSYFLCGLSLISVGATGLAWKQHLELIALREAVAATNRPGQTARSSNEEAANHARRAQLAIPQHQPDPGASVGDGAVADKSASLRLLSATLGNANGPESPREAQLELLAALADLPEFQKLVALQQRGAVDGKYAGLFHKLNLSPEQQQQLESLLTDKQSAFGDALLAARTQGLAGKEATDAARAIAQATAKDVDASIKSLLGDQGYQQYQNYERTMPQRETVAQLAQRLNYTDTPLTAKQQDQLVQALATGARQDLAALRAQAAATGQSIPRPPAVLNSLPNALGGLGIGASNGAVITTSGITKAATVLSPNQLTTLEQLQQEQQAQLALGGLLRRNVAAPAPRPAPNPAPAVPKSGPG